MVFCKFHQTRFHFIVRNKGEKSSFICEADSLNFVQSLEVQVPKVLF